MPKLYNIRLHQGNGVYIGRGSSYGNPFIIEIDGDRDEVCNLYEQYALWRLSVQSDWLDGIKGKDLYCHCTPERCHGDTLLKLRQQLDRHPKKTSTKKLLFPGRIGKELVSKGFLRSIMM